MKVFCFPLISILFFASISYAESPNDNAWINRIQSLKVKYPDKFTPNNILPVYFEFSKPCPEYGETCRMLDISTSEKLDLFNNNSRKFSKEVTHGIKAIPDIIRNGYESLFYNSLVEFYEKHSKNKLFPNGLRKLYPLLLKACRKYDFCAKSYKMPTIAIFPEEGLLVFNLPEGNWKVERTVLKVYFLLISEEESLFIKNNSRNK